MNLQKKSLSNLPKVALIDLKIKLWEKLGRRVLKYKIAI